MSDDRRKPVSREDALEMILAETAKNPYTPRRPVRPATQRTVRSATESSQTQERSEIPKSNAGYQNTTSQPLIRNAQKPVSSEEMMRPITEAQKAEEAKARAAKKIEEIKRAKQQREQREQLYAMYPPNPEDKKESTRVIPTVKQSESKKADYDEYDQQQDYDDYDEEYENNDYFEHGESSEYDYGYSSDGSITLDDILEIVESALAVIFVITLIFTYIIRVVVVDGASMSPTLEDKDKLIVRSIGYSPENGDVVVIDNDNAHLISESGKVVETEGLDKTIVKRVIATGGQTVNIDFESSIITVDGQKLTENYISEPTTRDEYAFNYPLTIPDGYVFVMGDNRNLSKDSRHPEIGLVPEDDIIGEVAMRVYPFGEFGGID